MSTGASPPPRADETRQKVTRTASLPRMSSIQKANGVRHPQHFQREQATTARSQAAKRAVLYRREHSEKSQPSSSKRSLSAPLKMGNGRESLDEKIRLGLERMARNRASANTRHTGSTDKGVQQGPKIAYHRSRSAPSSPPNTSNSSLTDSPLPGQGRGRRAAALRKQLTLLISELETLESDIPLGKPAMTAGWEMMVSECRKKEVYLKRLLASALEEVKVLKEDKAILEAKLQEAGLPLTSLDAELKEELTLAGCDLNPQTTENALKKKIRELQHERDALKLQLDVWTEKRKGASSIQDRASGLRQVELEARCSSHEQATKTLRNLAQLSLPLTAVHSLVEKHVPEDLRKAFLSDLSKEAKDHRHALKSYPLETVLQNATADVAFPGTPRSSVPSSPALSPITRSAPHSRRSTPQSSTARRAPPTANGGRQVKAPTH